MQLTKLDEYKLADIEAINKVRNSVRIKVSGDWRANLRLTGKGWQAVETLARHDVCRVLRTRLDALRNE